VTDDRTPEEVVRDVENGVDYALGPAIEETLEALVEELDERYA
jgi:hypothetical protein